MLLSNSCRSFFKNFPIFLFASVNEDYLSLENTEDLPTDKLSGAAELDSESQLTKYAGLFFSEKADDTRTSPAVNNNLSNNLNTEEGSNTESSGNASIPSQSAVRPSEEVTASTSETPNQGMNWHSELRRLLDVVSGNAISNSQAEISDTPAASGSDTRTPDSSTNNSYKLKSALKSSLSEVNNTLENSNDNLNIPAEANPQQGQKLESEVKKVQFNLTAEVRVFDAAA